MGQQIIQQPDGKYAIWSTVVDGFVLIDAEPNDIINHWLESERERITKIVAGIIEQLERGEKPYYQFTMDWYEALHTHKQVHGKEFSLEAERAAGQPEGV